MSQKLKPKTRPSDSPLRGWNKKWLTKEVILPIILATISCIGVVFAGIFNSSIFLKFRSPSPTPILPQTSMTSGTLTPKITPFANITGGKIFFIRSNNFYMINAEGLNENLIIKNPEAYISCVSISPDGEMLVFTSNFEGHADIYTIKRDGTNLRNLTKSGGFEEVCGAWSPDQKHILFYRQYSISSDILIIDVDGKNETNITDIFSSSENNLNTIAETPWSPDGTKFVFQSDRDGDFDIYIYDLNTKQTTKVTDTPTDEYKAAWSPNGDKITYTKVMKKQDYDIFMLDVSTSPLPSIGVNITNNPAYDTDSAWSPDGNQLAFISDRAGNAEIYIMDIDGNNILKLTNTPDSERRPRWIR
jgi:Tol biopolymer transport system component